MRVLYAPALPSGKLMCEKCIQIDHTIERYRRITRSINDDLTVEGAKKLIVDLESQKALFHPKRAE